MRFLIYFTIFSILSSCSQRSDEEIKALIREVIKDEKVSFKEAYSMPNKRDTNSIKEPTNLKNEVPRKVIEKENELQSEKSSSSPSEVFEEEDQNNPDLKERSDIYKDEKDLSINERLKKERMEEERREYGKKYDKSEDALFSLDGLEQIGSAEDFEDLKKSFSTSSTYIFKAGNKVYKSETKPTSDQIKALERQQ